MCSSTEPLAMRPPCLEAVRVGDGRVPQRDELIRIRRRSITIVAPELLVLRASGDPPRR